MKRLMKFLPLVAVASLTACAKETYQRDLGYYFDAQFEVSLYAKNSKVIKEINKICQSVDAMADAYQKRDTFNVYDLNQTNEKVEVDYEFYHMLECAKLASEKADNYNLLIGSLSDKWKEALANKEVLSDSIIQEELNKISNSSLSLYENDDKYYVQRIGEAKVDLGGAAKGYALDKIYSYLYGNGISEYLINAGSSSVLLGENKHSKTMHGYVYNYYVVSLRDVPDTYLKVACRVVSTSGNDVQGVEINETTYSHIVNPKTGSAITENDAVIVVNDCGQATLGDVLSTSLMMNTVDEIKEIEEQLEINTIVIKDHKIIYQNPDITFLH